MVATCPVSTRRSAQSRCGHSVRDSGSWVSGAGGPGLIEIDRDRKNGSDYVIDLTEEVVNKVGRTGGTFLHSSRTRPSHVPQTAVPDHLRDRYTGEDNDLTNEVLANIEYLGIDTHDSDRR